MMENHITFKILSREELKEDPPKEDPKDEVDVEDLLTNNNQRIDVKDLIDWAEPIKHFTMEIYVTNDHE